MLYDYTVNYGFKVMVKSESKLLNPVLSSKCRFLYLLW